ncbi:hypothetical protein JYG23_04545 [Sedimentibacter sp. zth1]|uniref:hypothetical protein n=1 Tax=Sedimentibacter sp. zth1 TaxID=2816908 RepID=UPI001A92B7FB|nr:hypothetical protein [Sedimentibacter sp. zth1]QSX06725.1 hypothetical protein JYG23_04545 [Sedimentibacter sp. zth1]
MECNRINKLKIIDLEIYEDCDNLDNGMSLSKEEIKKVVPCVLREKMWFKLVSDDSFYVHFGYDFNMYIGANESSDEVLNKIESNNLFVEVFESHYFDASKND